MTASFHKYDKEKFFPGTGDIDRTGPVDESNPGAHHAVNVPLDDGITDDQYIWLFQTVIGKCVSHFRPTAIVLQCGADSLAGDRLGSFNVQVQGHGACVAYCKSLDLPLLLVGGGGYTPRNVARAWAHETSIVIGCDGTLDPMIPRHTPYYSHFKYDSLFPTIAELLGSPRGNKNTQRDLNRHIEKITEQLRMVKHAPSVQSTHIPPDLTAVKQDVEDRLREEAENDERLRHALEESVGTAMEL